MPRRADVTLGRPSVVPDSGGEFCHVLAASHTQARRLGRSCPVKCTRLGGNDKRPPDQAGNLLDHHQLRPQPVRMVRTAHHDAAARLSRRGRMPQVTPLRPDDPQRVGRYRLTGRIAGMRAARPPYLGRTMARRPRSPSRLLAADRTPTARPGTGSPRRPGPPAGSRRSARPGSWTPASRPTRPTWSASTCRDRCCPRSSPRTGRGGRRARGAGDRRGDRPGRRPSGRARAR